MKSKKYTDWVKSLPCCVTRMPADDPHHIIGYGLSGMGQKPSDIFCIPLTRDKHNELHLDITRWEEFYGCQVHHCIDTIKKGIKDCVIDSEIVYEEIIKIKNKDLRRIFEKCLL